MGVEVELGNGVDGGKLKVELIKRREI